MDKNNTAAAVENTADEELFAALAKKKKARRRKRVITIAVIVGLLAIALVIAVINLRHRVTQKFITPAGNVKTYEATLGSVSTIVSGSGVLEAVEQETLTVPADVEIEEVLVSEGDNIAMGDIIATVDTASAMQAMKETQKAVDDIDTKIRALENESVPSAVTAGVTGRVKAIYAAAGDDVNRVMYNCGALAELSLDGNMAVEITADMLAEKDTVTVTRGSGALTGVVSEVFGGTAVVLVPDEDVMPGEQLTVSTVDGRTLGSGEAYIHSPLRLSGYYGTVSYVNVTLNSKVWANSVVFSLTDTKYTAGHQNLLKQREDLEDTLQELAGLYRLGGIAAEYDCSVDSVLYDEDKGIIPGTETMLAVVSPNEKMAVVFDIDERDILSLEEGQQAEVTISSTGSEDSFPGVVTEISRTATGMAGVTKYSATAEIAKTKGMIAGMTADVAVSIQGVDNTVIVPADAVHQSSTSAYVYTEYDEETGEFGGRVDVTTGISNSNFTEILSGLKEGDTVRYVEKQRSWFSRMSRR